MSKVENEKIKSLINNQIEQDETSTEHIPSPLSSLHRSASPYRSSHRRLNFIDRPNLILETRNHIPHCGTPRQPLVLRTSHRLVGWVLITLGHSTYLKVRTSVSREGLGLSKTINMVGKLVWKGGTGGGGTLWLGVEVDFKCKYHFSYNESLPVPSPRSELDRGLSIS
jgi:hypothetical protein